MGIFKERVIEIDILKAKDAWEVFRHTKIPIRLHWDNLSETKRQELIETQAGYRVWKEMTDILKSTRI